MKKIRILYALIGFLLAATGIILITEGGLHISHLPYDELTQYTTEDMADSAPYLLECSEYAIGQVFTGRHPYL